MEMKAIGEEVGSWMRSGILVLDLPRVVEELVFNSLDAAATKVSVHVSVGTCSVKVVDDGCGISRDGLVLLGQRYATSKLHPTTDLDPSNKSFGSRGEALASISDVSLLEIVTRTSGIPNGYRKVLKGSKCLYLGIDDDRKEVGTTGGTFSVIVRDLFYNQPVRRRCMQSSSKKVLQSVKKCVFRIALVQSKVFFKVFDSDSEEELLNTRPSSALSLLMDGFGIKDPSLLHKLNFADGLLKISGYVSGPSDCLSLKAFQYVYINSRFVCKGPIHKLLNRLASKFECLDAWKADHGSHKRKRGRLQANPSYILNLCCPPSLCSLTFELSKTCVEFKDWVPILTFTEKAIQQIWKIIPNADICGKKDIRKANDYGASMEEELSGSGRMNCDIQNYQSCQVSSPSSETLLEKPDHKQDKVSVKDFNMHLSPCEEQLSCINLGPSNGDIILHDPFSKYMCTNYTKGDRDLLTVHDNFSFEDAEDIFTARKRHGSEVEVGISSYSKHELSVGRNIASKSILSWHPPELDMHNNSDGSFLQNCVSRSRIPFDSTAFRSDEGLDFLVDDFETKRQQISSDEDSYNKIIDTCDRRSTSSFWKRESSHVSDSNFSEAYKESFWFDGGPFAGENYLASDSVAWKRSYSPENHCSVVTSDPLFQTVTWKAESVSDTCMHAKMEDSCEKTQDCVFSDNKVQKCEFGFEIMSRNFGQDNCMKSLLASNKFGHRGYDFCVFPEQCALPNDIYSINSCQSVDGRETNWLLSDVHSKIQDISFEFKGQNVVEYASLRHEVVPDREPRRSYSAPPFCKQKKSFVAITNPSVNMLEENEPELLHHAPLPPLLGAEICGLQHLDSQANHVADLVVQSGSDASHDPVVPLYTKDVHRGEAFRHVEKLAIPDSSVEGVKQDIPEPNDSGTKWRNDSQQIRHYPTDKADTEDAILDISSGFLHLAGSSLVPGSLTKNFLGDAKVLQQVDKKFIPVVAGGTLAIIDQHAADERIRLEELHEKVLTGEAKTISYLDAEQQLILPEIGHQLLHDYGKQIKEWGWICNFDAMGSDTFKKSLNVLHQQANVVTLLAVPCILGVNLSDGDLLEFLQQLADTDGSSSVPPSVHRVLNLKACRGAIMFGDTLQPSECALIVEELKKTSLCFQCAHGRPTTAPLVNLEVLHEQIAKLGVPHSSSCQSWHGLRRQDLSLERAAQRLSAVRV